PRLMLGVMDVFILPSFYEGLPVVSLEAQAASLPCFISDRVTREMDVVPGLVHWYPIDSAPELWAKRLANIYRSSHESEALTYIEQSPFEIQYGVHLLEQLYSSGSMG
ncbi:MAG: glycosyltransferase, partial [Anaerolineae bacterium]|nr:glycosyltransferase [Anaerolineae bacterium]